MPADGKGAKGNDVMTKTHAAGAAGSYGARYLLKGIFNVAIGENDDDGNGATPRTRQRYRQSALRQD
jgi:ribosomal protein L37AE/L43A